MWHLKVCIAQGKIKFDDMDNDVLKGRLRRTSMC
jgi:hypothetical protein